MNEGDPGNRHLPSSLHLWYKQNVGTPHPLSLIVSLLQAPELLARILRMIDEHPATARAPVTWNLPCVGIMDHSSKLAELSIGRIVERVEDLGDRLLPMGYSGVPHRLLRADELANELRWAHRNKWKSGVADRVRNPLPCILPDQSDFTRPAAVELYHDAQIAAAGPILSPCAWFGAGTEQSDDRERAIRRLRRMIGKAFRSSDGASLLRLRASNERDVDTAKLVLDALLPRLEHRRDCLVPAECEWIGGASASQPAPFVGAEATKAPPARVIVQAADQRVSGRRSVALCEQTLRVLAGHETANAATEPPPRAPARDLLSTMPGDSILSGPGFDACFDAGRFVGLVGSAASRPALREARSVIIHRRTRHEMLASSSFSLETTLSRGIRGEEIVTLDEIERSAVVATEALFVEELGGLLINVTIHADRSPIELRLLEAPVGTGDSCEITSIYPDGSGCRIVGEGEAAGWGYHICGEFQEFTVTLWSRGGSPVIADNLLERREDAWWLALGGRWQLERTSEPEPFLSIVVCPESPSTGLAATLVKTRRLPAAMRREISLPEALRPAPLGS